MIRSNRSRRATVKARSLATYKQTAFLAQSAFFQAAYTEAA